MGRRAQAHLLEKNVEMQCNEAWASRLEGPWGCFLLQELEVGTLWGPLWGAPTSLELGTLLLSRGHAAGHRMEETGAGWFLSLLSHAHLQKGQLPEASQVYTASMGQQ